MKSAYELALERMEKEAGPSKKLTDEQREALAEIDRKFDAQIAAQRLSLEKKMAIAMPAEAVSIRQELAAAVAELEEKREYEKENVWKSGS